MSKLSWRMGTKPFSDIRRRLGTPAWVVKMRVGHRQRSRLTERAFGVPLATQREIRPDPYRMVRWRVCPPLADRGEASDRAPDPPLPDSPGFSGKIASR